jgi:hypothetical protein
MTCGFHEDSIKKNVPAGNPRHTLYRKISGMPLFSNIQGCPEAIEDLGTTAN